MLRGAAAVAAKSSSSTVQPRQRKLEQLKKARLLKSMRLSMNGAALLCRRLLQTKSVHALRELSLTQFPLNQQAHSTCLLCVCEHRFLRRQVVTLDAGTTALCYREEDLARLQTIIQDSHATPEQLILTLRKLSCHEISLHDLEGVPLLHPSVQAGAVNACMYEAAVECNTGIVLGDLVWSAGTIALGLQEASRAMQMLEYHRDADVARIAGRLVDKWMALEDRRGKLPPATAQHSGPPKSWGSLPFDRQRSGSGSRR